MPLKISLAGPDVFLADAVEIGRQKLELCRHFGFQGIFPLDQDEADAFGIFRANRSLMRQADIGLFNLTPFRGPSAESAIAKDWDLGRIQDEADRRDCL